MCCLAMQGEADMSSVAILFIILVALIIVGVPIGVAIGVATMAGLIADGTPIIWFSQTKVHHGSKL